MSIPFEGLTGAAYAYTDKYAAVERCVDFILTPNESAEESKFKFMLDQAPGNMEFGQLPVPDPFNVPCRGIVGTQFGLYGVSGNKIWQMSSSGVYTSVGTLVNSTGFTNSVSFCINGNGQLGIADDSFFYVVAMETNALTAVANTDYIAGGKVTFQDGYALAVNNSDTQIGGANYFQISGTDAVPLGDLTQWDPANISIQEGQADALQDIISSREYVRILGKERSQVYYNAGANGAGGFPFQSYNETFIEEGTAAIFALDDLGDSLIWVAHSKRGTASCWQDFGFQPQRVSTFAIEQFWQSYGDLSDAISFTFKWKGHLIWQVTFPSANSGVGATWCYDSTASKISGRPIWFERTFRLWSGSGSGAPVGRPERYHAFCYGLHLVASAGADGNPGAVYQYADSGYDCGVNNTGGQVHNAQIPMRVTPHLYNGLNRVIVDRLTVAGNRPMQLQISRTGETPDPAGRVFVPNQDASEPQRSYFNRLGVARDWVFALMGDGTPNINTIIAGTLNARSGSE